MQDKFLRKKRGFKDESATLSDVWQSPETVARILKWLQEERGIFTFSGPRGTGKTYIAKAIENDWLKSRNLNFRSYKAGDFFTQVKSVYKEDWDATQEIKRLCETEWFLLDDFGIGTQSTEWQVDRMAEFIDERYESDLPTILTTNLKPSQIKEISEGRIFSRLMDHRNLFVIADNEEDRRINPLR